MSRRIYVASSWRCATQPAIVAGLRRMGHEVYDFRNPGETPGFGWSEIDPNWQSWSSRQYRDKLEHPRAVEGFAADYRAMEWADTFVLVLPCGRSAHLELGWAIGQGKPAAILLSDDRFEPELMYQLVDFLAVDPAELAVWLDGLDDPDPYDPDPWAGGDCLACDADEQYCSEVSGCCDRCDHRPSDKVVNR